jgi:hypothetical protein
MNPPKPNTMKKFFFVIAMLGTGAVCMSQDFATDIKNAKTSYTAGSLGDAHFALLQALQEVDIIIGKEVLKLLPKKMDTASAIEKNDQVAASVGYIGTTINRTYGQGESASINIISNSPMVATLNTFLNTPILGGMMSDGTSKIIKVQGYKGRLQKEGDNQYSVQIPLNNALLTFNTKNISDTKTLELANTLPVPAIAKLIQ